MRLLRDVEDVGHVQERGRLLSDGAHHPWMAVAERGHGDAAGEVEVLLAVGVPHPQPSPAHQGDRLRLVNAIRCLSAMSISCFVSTLCVRRISL